MKDRRTFICLRCWIPYSHQWHGLIIFLPQLQLLWELSTVKGHTTTSSCVQITTVYCPQQLLTIWFFFTFRAAATQHTSWLNFFFVKLHNILLPWCGLRILRPSPQQTTSNGLIPHPVVEVPHTLIIHSRQYSYYFEANCQTQCGGQDNNAEVRWGHCRGCFRGHDDIYL